MFPFNVVHVFLFILKSRKFVLDSEHGVKITVETEGKFSVLFYLFPRTSKHFPPSGLSAEVSGF